MPDLTRVRKSSTALRGLARGESRRSASAKFGTDCYNALDVDPKHVASYVKKRVVPKAIACERPSIVILRMRES